MSDSVSRSVEVAVAPDVAFAVFTEQIDAWYRVDRGALPDITRTAAIRFEPQLGGRLLDVHDLATGEGRELGRITVWEPGSRLVFVDNEGTEVEVTFARQGAGTRVTLTHRGLDAIAPRRARALRRAGWPSLAPVYRDHIAPNARPLALAIGYFALLGAVVAGLSVVLAPRRNDVAAVSIVVVAIFAASIVLWNIEGRLIRRWLRSRWQYKRMQQRVLMLVAVAIAVWQGYEVSRHPAHWSSLVIATSSVILAWTLGQSGPAGGESLRKRLSSSETILTRHQRRSRVLWVGLVALAVALPVLVSFYVSAAASAVLLLAWITAYGVWRTASRRRQTHSLGFDPDLYLSVGRGVSEENQRPELLLYQPSELPEYSGWWAYGTIEDRSHSFVAWSLKDLIDQAPEAVEPLRAGQGQWKWDQARGAYRRTDRPAGNVRPA